MSGFEKDLYQVQTPTFSTQGTLVPANLQNLTKERIVEISKLVASAQDSRAAALQLMAEAMLGGVGFDSPPLTEERWQELWSLTAHRHKATFDAGIRITLAGKAQIAWFSSLTPKYQQNVTDTAVLLRFSS
jgi:hypothetical protein